MFGRTSSWRRLPFGCTCALFARHSKKANSETDASQTSKEEATRSSRPFSISMTMQSIGARLAGVHRLIAISGRPEDHCGPKDHWPAAGCRGHAMFAKGLGCVKTAFLHSGPCPVGANRYQNELPLPCLLCPRLALEGTCRNTPVKVFTLGLLGLAAFDGNHVIFGRHRNLVRRKPGHRQRNLIAVVGEPFDIVGRVVILASALGDLGKVEKAVEANGRTPQGREVISAHSQILQRAKWLRAAPDTTGARLNFSGPIRRPGHLSGDGQKN